MLVYHVTVRVGGGRERSSMIETGGDEWYDGMRPFLFLFRLSAFWRQPLAISWDRSVLHAYIEFILPFHCDFGDIPLKVSSVWRNMWAAVHNISDLFVHQ